MINGISFSANPLSYSYNTANTGNAADYEAYSGAIQQPQEEGQEHKIIRNPGESTEKQAGKKSSPAECETCKNRKYQDGSDENVSYKAAAHISPDAAASRVMSHEQEHVSNAYKEAAQNNGKVVSCNVSLKTSICPECGRTFVSGGTTATQIKYFNEDNPYQKDMKSSDAVNKYRGMNVDIAC